MNTANLSYDELLNLLNNQQNIINNQQDMLNKLSSKNKLDPYKILNISKNYDLSSLKKAYLKQALIHHPDKGGNPADFKNIVISYKVLLKKYNNDQVNLDHNSLKTDLNSFVETQNSDNKQNLKLNKKFSKEQFNKVFDQNKVSTVYDDGYGDWYKSTSESKQLFNSKVGMSTFNNAFEQEKKKKLAKKKNQIQLREPEEKISYGGADSIVVLGQEKINNFGGSTSNGLHYYDLKKAYDDNYINDTIEDVSTRTISSVKSERSNISYKMSDKDLKKYNENKIKQEQLEKSRLKKLQQDDDMASKLYDRIHSRLIGGA